MFEILCIVVAIYVVVLIVMLRRRSRRHSLLEQQFSGAGRQAMAKDKAEANFRADIDSHTGSGSSNSVLL